MAQRQRRAQPVLVSEMVPLVSKVPPITLPRHWGIMPSFRWGKSIVPAARRRELAPKEMGLLGFLATVLTAPVLGPFKLVSSIAKPLREHAESESDQETALRERLLEVKMRYELGEITKEEFEKKEAEFKEKIEELKK